MKNFKTLPLLFFLFLITSNAQSPQYLIQETTKKILNSQSVYFTQEAHYPNPVGKIDTVTTRFQLQKNENTEIGFDALLQDKYFDVLYKNGKYTSVNHRKKVVELHTKMKPEQMKQHFEGISSYKRSPLPLLTKN
ncbi:MAG: hypothetical protein R3359_10625, partial [Marinirhabdus sp.]|nr:hypothetical protein [Marinirhabdus sp.]